MDLHKIDWENIPWEPVREGITRKSFSGNGATLALHKLMPKHEPKPHKHTYEQLVYILAGHIRFHVGDKSVVLGPGRPAANPAGRHALGRGGRRRAGPQSRYLHAGARGIRPGATIGGANPRDHLCISAGFRKLDLNSVTSQRAEPRCRNGSSASI